MDKAAVLQGIAQNVDANLRMLGQDTNREGLSDTPMRHAKYLWEFLTPEEPFKFTDFESEGATGVLLKCDIDFFSLCEHHLLPFFGVAHVAYIPGAKSRIVGISKLPRCVRHFSRRLQNQERLTMQIAKCLSEELNTESVGVQLIGRHLCEEMRGIESIGSKTITTHLIGAFKNDPITRQEYLSQIQTHSKKVV